MKGKKRWISGLRMIIAGIMVSMGLLGLGGAAASETEVWREVAMPDGQSCVWMPSDMIPTAVDPEETDLWADYVREPDLEMLIFTYDAQDATARGLAEGLKAAGREAAVRKIDGVEFLTFQDMDEADGAICLGYAYIAAGRMIEISFFCGSQAAIDRTAEIMETFAQRE